MARILIVDDEPDACEELRLFLTKRGHEVLIAYSGEDALAIVEGESPHLMLLDIRIPGINGIEVLKRVRENDNRVSVCVMSALRDEMTVREALSLGADGYIRKPIQLASLESSVLTKFEARKG